MTIPLGSKIQSSFRLRKIALILLVGLFLSFFGIGLSGSLRPVAAASATSAYFDHVVIIVMEDHGINQICAQNPPPCLSSNGAPYSADLANKYGIGSQYLGVSHFSQANYIALLGGDIYGCVGYPCQPSSHANLVDRFEAAGLTWRGYMEDQGLASGCDTSSNQLYNMEHNPFVFFTDITSNPARCANVLRANPTSCSATDCTLINDLNSASAPNFMFLTPNECDNMHGATGVCPVSISTGDNYLNGLVPNILNSQTFTTQRSALFIVFDEGEGYCPLNNSSEDCVYAVWAGPAAKTGFSSTNLFNHYSFTKTIETNWNLPSLASNDAAATPMTEFFTTTTTPPLSTSFTFTPSSPSTGQTVTFTGSAAGGRSPYDFNWNFGDGTTGKGNPVSHSYSAPGSFTVQLLTNDSAGATASTSHAVTVTQPATPDFTISSNRSTLQIPPGGSGSSTVTLTSTGGFAGTISLSASISPNGPSISLVPASVTLAPGGSAISTLTVTTQSSTPTGTYTVTTTGTSGSLSHSNNILVTVMVAPNFSISASPSSITVHRTTSGKIALSLKSLNEFSGIVNLSMTVSRSGLRTSLSSLNVNLTPGGTSSDLLTIGAGRRAPIGTYMITVTATSGTIHHTTTITVTVT